VSYQRVISEQQSWHGTCLFFTLQAHAAKNSRLIWMPDRKQGQGSRTYALIGAMASGASITGTVPLQDKIEDEPSHYTARSRQPVCPWTGAYHRCALAPKEVLQAAR